MKSENMFQTQLGPKILAIMARLPQTVLLISITTCSVSYFFQVTTAEKISFLQMVFQVYDSELCMLALPPDRQQLLSRISQYLFCQGIIPVVVRNPTEALIHSRHSHFVAIILPDNDPLLIRNIRSVNHFYMNLNYFDITFIVIIYLAE